MASLHRLTLGAVEFAAWRKNRSQADAAKLLDLAQQTVSKIERGIFVPTDWAMVERFRATCGIAPAAWTTATRRRAPDPTRTRPAKPA